MALRQFAVCRLSEAQCLGSRCPLAEHSDGMWAGCRDGWLRWDTHFLPLLTELGKARLNLYLRLHDFPLPEEIRFAPVGPPQ